MNNQTICYVMCAYVGPNRASINIENTIIRHIIEATNVENIDYRIIVIPNSKYETMEFQQELTKQSSSMNWTVIRRENTGYSYASFIEAYEQSPDYDWYIFQEDDYIPFDMNLCEKLLKHAIETKSEYVGQVYERKHMSSSCGILSNAACSILHANFKRFIGLDAVSCQLLFSRILHDAKITMCDILNSYPTIYRCGSNVASTYYLNMCTSITPNDTNPLWMPAQFETSVSNIRKKIIRLRIFNVK